MALSGNSTDLLPSPRFWKDLGFEEAGFSKKLRSLKTQPFTMVTVKSVWAIFLWL